MLAPPRPNTCDCTCQIPHKQYNLTLLAANNSGRTAVGLKPIVGPRIATTPVPPLPEPRTNLPRIRPGLSLPGLHANLAIHHKPTKSHGPIIDTNRYTCQTQRVQRAREPITAAPLRCRTRHVSACGEAPSAHKPKTNINGTTRASTASTHTESGPWPHTCNTPSAHTKPA